MKKKLHCLIALGSFISATVCGDERIQPVQFEADGRRLSGLLVTPARQAPHPVVVFMPGCGPFGKETFFANDPDSAEIRGCREIGAWHRFLEMGYACFAWDAPGVGDSRGDWREDTSHDRRRQLRAALRALKSLDEIDALRIGLWGAADAGWAVPAVAANTPDLAFVVLIGCPGTTMVEQGGLLLERDLLTAGVAKEKAGKAREIYTRKWEMTRAGVPFVALTKYVSDEIKLLGGIQHDWLKPWTLREHRDFSRNPEASEALFYSPVAHLKEIRAPLLAVFGKQGADALAYRSAFAKGKNERAVVATIDGAAGLLTGQGDETTVAEYWRVLERFLRNQVPADKRVSPGVVRRFAIGDGELEVVLNLHDEKSRTFEVNLTSLIRKAYAHFAGIMGGPPLDAGGWPISKLVIDVQSGRLAGEAHPGRLELTLDEEKVFGFLDWRALVIHELFHLWNAETFSYVDYREQWFNEGATEYMTFKALMKLGLVSREQGPLLLVRAWGNYNSARGIGEISLREAGHNDRKKGHYFLVYHGGVTACMIFDYEIRRTTNNQKSFEDLLRYLYETHNHTDRKYNAVSLIKALKAVGGADFTDFFRRHIHGTEIMPIGRYVTRMEVEAVRLGQIEKVPEPDRGVLHGLFELID